jgi:hypothetical protein
MGYKCVLASVYVGYILSESNGHIPNESKMILKIDTSYCMPFWTILTYLIEFYTKIKSCSQGSDYGIKVVNSAGLIGGQCWVIASLVTAVIVPYIGTCIWYVSTAFGIRKKDNKTLIFLCAEMKVVDRIRRHRRAFYRLKLIPI